MNRPRLPWARRRLTGLQALALALCLLFAQQHAGLHWLSHALQAVALADVQTPAQHDAHDTAPASQPVCDDCTAIAALDALPPPAPLPFGLAANGTAPPATAFHPHRPATRLAYLSRGPPLAA